MNSLLPISHSDRMTFSPPPSLFVESIQHLFKTINSETISCIYHRPTSFLRLHLRFSMGTFNSGAGNNKARTLLHNRTQCTQTHWISALLLVFATHLVTRVLDQVPAPANTTGFNQPGRSSEGDLQFDGGFPAWPQKGYGSHIDIKIYVYDENEIEGLKPLMYGKEGVIDVGICYQGQWGTQVISLNVTADIEKWKNHKAGPKLVDFLNQAFKVIFISIESL